ncbi:hypothetical protein H8D30_02615 [bacterium]|nr:hypothetical protein [bacterium]
MKERDLRKSTKGRWILVVLALFALFGGVEAMSGGLQNKGNAYLDQALGRARIAFATLSIMKATVGIVEGSDFEFGASFGASVGVDLEVGDIAQPLYDLIDKAWDIALVAWIALETERILLGISGFRIADWLIIVGLLALIAIAWGWVVPKLSWQRWGRAFILAGLVMRFMLPAAVWGTQVMSASLTAKPMEASRIEIEAHQRELGDLFGDIQRAPLLDRVGVFQTWMATHDKAWWDQYRSEVVRHAMLLSAAFLLDSVIFPILTLWLLMALGKRVVYSVPMSLPTPEA